MFNRFILSLVTGLSSLQIAFANDVCLDDLSDAKPKMCDCSEIRLPDTRFELSIGEQQLTVHAVLSDQSSKGKSVILLHEMDGLGLVEYRLANTLAERGFDVYLPEFFDGESYTRGRQLLFNFRNIFKLLVDDKWSLLSSSGNDAVVELLDGLVNDLAKKYNASIGVIGQCLTGALPLALAGNDSVGAVVLAQPSLPFLKITSARKSSLAIPDGAIESAIQRADSLRILAFRFSNDRFTDNGTLKSLCERLPSATVESLNGKAHSVLGNELCTAHGRRMLEKTINLLTNVALPVDTARDCPVPIELEPDA